MNKKQIAFTLIELLVVIAIIGILSGLIVVTMSGVTQKATIAKAQVFSNSLRNALMLNLISEWKLDDGSGTLAVDSWNGGNNLILADTGGSCSSTLCPQWQTGCVYGGCLSFNGTGAYAYTSNNTNLQFTGALTMEAWVNFNSLSGWGEIVGTGCNGQAGYRMYIHQTTHTIHLETKDGGGNYNDITGSPVNDTGKWYYVIGTMNQGGNGYVMVNDQKTSLATSYAAGLSGGGVTVGSCGGSQFFNGKIDNVRVYNTAVPVSQAKEHYYAGLNNLVASGRITIEEYNKRINNLAIK